MAGDLHIAPLEAGVIRVFAVNAAPVDIAHQINAQDAHGVAQALLGMTPARGGTDLVALADLTGIGLSGYLAEGYGVPQMQLKPHVAKLDALDGYALLVFSSAFEGRKTTLRPPSGLTHIATLTEPQPDHAARPLEAEAAAPYTGHATDHPQQQTKRPPFGSTLVVAALVGCAVLLWWILS